MDKPLIYQFQDISFTIHSINKVLIDYMDEYTNYQKVNAASSRNIDLYFTETDSLDDFVSNIDSDAITLEDRKAILDDD